MGQCVNKCKNPTSSLGSKSGEKDAGKSHSKKGSGGGGGGGGGGGVGGPKEEAKFPADVNGTKSPELTTAPPLTTPLSDVMREETPQEDGGLSLARVEEMFVCYKDEHEDAILEEGMERFCNDLHVDPAEFKVLVLAWKFQAATMCKFTRSEFVEGCKAIGADSVPGISQRFSAMLEESRSEENFKDLYRFTFQFGLDCGEGQRSLQRCIAVALWRLVFTLDTPPVLERWLRFLSENPCAVRGISRDTWNMFLNFTQSVGPDLSNYSEDEAWPSLFDSFVEWESDRRRRELEQPQTGEGDGGGGTESTAEPEPTA